MNFNDVGFTKQTMRRELYIIPGASHTDLYYGGDKGAIPFDKIETYMKEILN